MSESSSLCQLTLLCVPQCSVINNDRISLFAGKYDNMHYTHDQYFLLLRWELARYSFTIYSANVCLLPAL